eukprot:TRINITY_DN7157_c0_g1_i1.p1 TRINITY_DN7157_c0_g1~~TRINITY_DN7157_c0_g1_i1.p1  ORF type:complete len:1069 (+),score=206.71 TRINITY_DN7157_c0_g1_i1:515-3721(+)
MTRRLPLMQEFTADFSEETEQLNSVFVTPLNGGSSNRRRYRGGYQQRVGITTPPDNRRPGGGGSGAMRPTAAAPRHDVQTNIDVFLCSLRLGGEGYGRRLVAAGYEEAGDLDGLSKPDLIQLGVRPGHAQRVLNALPTLPNSMDASDFVPERRFSPSPPASSPRSTTFSPGAFSEFSVDAGLVALDPGVRNYSDLAASFYIALQATPIDEQSIVDTVNSMTMPDEWRNTCASFLRHHGDYRSGVLYKGLAADLSLQSLNQVRTKLKTIGIIIAEWEESRANRSVAKKAPVAAVVKAPTPLQKPITPPATPLNRGAPAGENNNNNNTAEMADLERKLQDALRKIEELTVEAETVKDKHTTVIAEMQEKIDSGGGGGGGDADPAQVTALQEENITLKNQLESLNRKLDDANGSIKMNQQNRIKADEELSALKAEKEAEMLDAANKLEFAQKEIERLRESVDNARKTSLEMPSRKASSAASAKPEPEEEEDPKEKSVSSASSKKSEKSEKSVKREEPEPEPEQEQEPEPEPEEEQPAEEEELPSGERPNDITQDYHLHAFHMTYGCEVPTIPASEEGYMAMWSKLCTEHNAVLEDWTQPPYQGALKYLLESFYERFNKDKLQNADKLRGQIASGDISLEDVIGKLCANYMEGGEPMWSGDFPSALRHPDHVSRILDALYTINDPDNMEANDSDVDAVINLQATLDDKLQEFCTKNNVPIEDWTGRIPKGVVRFTIDSLLGAHEAHDEQRVTDIVEEIMSGAKTLDESVTELCEELQEKGAVTENWIGYYPRQLKPPDQKFEMVERFFRNFIREQPVPNANQIDEILSRDEDLLVVLAGLYKEYGVPYESYFFFEAPLRFPQEILGRDYFNMITKFLQQYAPDKVPAAKELTDRALHMGYEDIWDEIFELSGADENAVIPESTLQAAPTSRYLTIRFTLESFFATHSPQNIEKAKELTLKLMQCANDKKLGQEFSKIVKEKAYKVPKGEQGGWEIKTLAGPPTAALFYQFSEMYKRFKPEDVHKAAGIAKNVAGDPDKREGYVNQMATTWQHEEMNVEHWLGEYPVALRPGW